MAASNTGVLIELAAGMGSVLRIWAKRPSSSTSTKPEALRSLWTAASRAQAWLRAVSSRWGSKRPRGKPWGRGCRGEAVAGRARGALMAPLARRGARSLRAVPVITPRPTPITSNRKTSLRGWPQLPDPGRSGRLELTNRLANH